MLLLLQLKTLKQLHLVYLKWLISITRAEANTWASLYTSYYINGTKTDRLYPSVPLENNDLEQRLEKKLNDVKSFNNPINNIKEMITYFKDKNIKSKNKYKKYKSLNTILDSIDSIIIIGATSTSKTLSITGIGLIILPISAGTACTLSLVNKVLQELIINKYNIYKKQFEIDQQTIKSFDNLSRKYLQDNLIDKNEDENLCTFFTNYLDETENESFFINERIKQK